MNSDTEAREAEAGRPPNKSPRRPSRARSPPNERQRTHRRAPSRGKWSDGAICCYPREG